MKKQINLILVFLMFTAQSFAQYQRPDDLRVVFLDDVATVHFVSPEPIQYVDISTNSFVGDIPVDNLLRIKYYPSPLDSTKTTFQMNRQDEAIVTVVGQSFYAQYILRHIPHTQHAAVSTSIEILPEAMRALEFPQMTLTRNEMKNYSLEILKRKRTFFNVASKENGMLAYLNNIYTFGDYIFVDVSFKNNTKIKYDVDEFRFNIKDKRITKATNVQDIEIQPVFTLYDQPFFRKNYRNIFVFQKFTYPNDKVLSLQMTENQISGRVVELKIDYRDLLSADNL